MAVLKLSAQSPIGIFRMRGVGGLVLGYQVAVNGRAGSEHF